MPEKAEERLSLTTALWEYSPEALKIVGMCGAMMEEISKADVDGLQEEYQVPGQKLIHALPFHPAPR